MSRDASQPAHAPAGRLLPAHGGATSCPTSRGRDCAMSRNTMSRNTTRKSVDPGRVAECAASPAAPRLPLGEPPVRPTFARERAAIKRGVFPVAGCDEAGRGPLAGPVVAAAVILDPKHIPRGLDDSKKLTAVERERLYERIFATSEVGVA